MKSLFKHHHFPFILAVICFTAFGVNVQAEEVDFSCVKLDVRGKRQVTDRYKEYDVQIRNQCPGAVYWSMCIERMDPWSNAIVETHTPTGRVERDKKARVNLQMKRGPEERFRNRFQEFYVSAGYAINSAATAQCNAGKCESRKSSLRAQARANEQAWQNAEDTLAKRLAAECPESSWGGTDQDECEAAINEASQPGLELLEQIDVELRKKLVEFDPVQCQVHGGDIVVY